MKRVCRRSSYARAVGFRERVLSRRIATRGRKRDAICVSSVSHIHVCARSGSLYPGFPFYDHQTDIKGGSGDAWWCRKWKRRSALLADTESSRRANGDCALSISRLLIKLPIYRIYGDALCCCIGAALSFARIEHRKLGLFGNSRSMPQTSGDSA